MSSHRFLIASSLTGEVLAELPLTRASYTHTLGESGKFSGTLPLDLPNPLAAVLKGVFFSADPELDVPAIYVERDAEIVWGGLVWGDQAEYPGGTQELTAEGWHSWLQRRTLTDDLVFVQTDQALIAKALIDWAQEDFGASALIDTSDVVPTGKLRDRTYHAYERRGLGETLEQLSQVIDGFAFRFASEWRGNSIVTRFLVDYPPSRLTPLVFEVDNQVISARVTTDRSQLATAVHGIGAGEGDLSVRSYNDDESLIGARLWLDAVVTYTDVTERDTLEDHGAERLARGSRPIVIPELTVRADRHPMVGDYRVGDVVGATGRRGYHDFSGSYRITEDTVDIDDGGTEEVTLKLAPAGVFNPAGAVVPRAIQPASVAVPLSIGVPAVEVDENLLFFDDFDVVHATNRGLDPASWFVHDRPTGDESYVNNEWQLYVPQNVSVEDGRLVITCHHLGGEGPGSYSSGLVTTAGKVHVGPPAAGGGIRIEIRLKAPGSDGATQGLWPSLYTLEHGSADYFGGNEPGFPGGAQGVPGWPTTGKSEVDIWEWPGFSAFEYHTNRHWSETPGGSNPVGGREVDTSPIDITDSFNNYAFVWTTQYMSWEFNGAEKHRILPGVSPPPSQPMFCIINFAIGGDFGGEVGEDTVFPARYEIDWIRVSELSPPAKMHLELVDSFNPPLGVWTAVGDAGQLVTAGGAITVTCADNYPGLRTTSGDYSLDESWAFVEVSEVPAEGNGSTQAWLTCTFNHVEGSTPQGEIRIGYSGGNLVGEYQLGGVYTETFSIPYDPTAMRYWALAAAGGEIGFSYADDGSTWVNPSGSTIDISDVGFSITALDVELTCGFFGTETDPGQAVFEGLNIVGFVPEEPTGDKPNAGNTGLTNAGALTSAGFDRVTQDGQVITDLEFDVGYVEVQASNVTFRNCRFIGPSSREALVRLQSGQTGLLFEDCEVDGQGDGTGVALAYGNYTARRVYIHDVVDGVKLGDNTTLEACYITDLATGPGTHNDGAQSSGGNNIVVRGCTIENQHGQTSAILIGADLSDIDNVLIEGNWLSGGGFCLYAGSDPGFNLTNCVIRDNVMGSGEFGFTSFTESEEIDFVDNVDTDGDPLPDRHFP